MEQIQLKKTFNPSPELVAAAEAVFMTMALVGTIKPVVTAYKTEILKEGGWRAQVQVSERLGGNNDVILDPNMSYLLSDADFAVYDEKCKEARIKAKLYVEKENQCPLLIAEHLNVQANHALIQAMYEYTQIDTQKLLCAGLDKYQKYIELMLKLLAPFVKTDSLKALLPTPQ